MTISRILFTTTILSGIALVAGSAPGWAAPVNDLIVNDDIETVISGSNDYGKIWIGNDNDDQSATFDSTAIVTSTTALLGVENSSTDNSLIVEGQWTNDETVTVGFKGADNTLTIQNSGAVNSNSTWIGGYTSASGNKVIVDDATLVNDDNTTVGYGSSGNSLVIQNGGAVTNLNGFVGFGDNADVGLVSDDNVVTVTGEDSIWNTTGVLHLGYTGSDNELNVEKEGQVTVGADMLLGFKPESDGNAVTVNGNVSKLAVTGRLYVGRDGDSNTVTIEEGGRLETGTARIGGGTGSTSVTQSNSVTITGEGSTWSNSGSLHIGAGIGANGSSGNELNVENGGAVTLGTSSTIIGFGAIDSNNKLVVTGEGSSFTTQGKVLVGANTSNAVNSLLELDDGGEVQAGEIAVGGSSTLRMGTGTSLMAGTFSLASGATLDFAVDDDNTPSIAYSTVAGVSGTLNVDVAAAGVRQNRIDVVAAADPDLGVLSGTFAEVNVSGLGPHFSYDLSYSGSSAYLTFNAELAEAGGFTNNQQNVAGGIDDYFNTGGTLTGSFSALYDLTGDALATALTQISGEAGASGGAQAITRATASFLNLLSGPGHTGGSTEMATTQPDGNTIMPAADVPAAAAGGWSVWAATFGGSANLPGDNDAGSHDTSSDAFGIATGWDLAMSDDTLLGLAVAGGGTRWNIDDGLGDGDSTFLQLGAHVTQRFGSSYLSAAGAYAWHSMSTERTVDVMGSERLEADFNASNLSGRIEGGHRFDTGGALGLTPYAALQAQAIYLPDYEEDTGEFAIAYESQTDTALRSEIGLRLDATADAVRFNAGLAWAHDWTSDSDVTAAFQALPGSSFTVFGAEAPSDVALVSAGAAFGMGTQTSLAASFNGEFAEAYQSYAGSVALRYSW